MYRRRGRKKDGRKCRSSHCQSSKRCDHEGHPERAMTIAIRVGRRGMDRGTGSPLARFIGAGLPQKRVRLRCAGASSPIARASPRRASCRPRERTIPWVRRPAPQWDRRGGTRRRFPQTIAALPRVYDDAPPGVDTDRAARLPAVPVHAPIAQHRIERNKAEVREPGHRAPHPHRNAGKCVVDAEYNRSARPGQARKAANAARGSACDAPRQKNRPRRTRRLPIQAAEGRSRRTGRDRAEALRGAAPSRREGREIGADHNTVRASKVQAHLAGSAPDVTMRARRELPLPAVRKLAPFGAHAKRVEAVARRIPGERSALVEPRTTSVRRSPGNPQVGNSVRRLNTAPHPSHASSIREPLRARGTGEQLSETVHLSKDRVYERGQRLDRGRQHQHETKNAEKHGQRKQPALVGLLRHIPRTRSPIEPAALPSMINRRRAPGLLITPLPPSGISPRVSRLCDNDGRRYQHIDGAAPECRIAFESRTDQGLSGHIERRVQ